MYLHGPTKKTVFKIKITGLDDVSGNAISLGIATNEYKSNWSLGEDKGGNSIGLYAESNDDGAILWKGRYTKDFSVQPLHKTSMIIKMTIDLDKFRLIYTCKGVYNTEKVTVGFSKKWCTKQLKWIKPGVSFMRYGVPKHGTRGKKALTAKIIEAFGY